MLLSWGLVTRMLAAEMPLSLFKVFDTDIMALKLTI